MKIKYTALLFLAFLALVSCSGYRATVGVVRAPEIVIPGAKKLSVDQFEVFDLSTHSALIGLPERHKKLLEDAISDDLTFELAHSDSSGARIGGRLTFTSSVSTLKLEKKEEVSDDGKEKDKNENENENENNDEESEKRYITKTYYKVMRAAALHVDWEVADSLGNIIGSRKFELNKLSAASDESLSYAERSVSTAHELWEELMRSSIHRIMGSIRINQTSEDRYFEKVKKNKQFKMANKAASKGDWNYALSIWETEAALNPIAKAASLFNQSIYYESIGDLKTAGDLLEEATKIEPNGRRVERLNEIRRLNREAKIIEENY